MKILQVNCVYKSGSTGKIVHDHHNELLKRGIDSIIAYANGPVFKDKNVYKISKPIEQKAEALYSRLTGIMYGGCHRQTRRLTSIIQKENPDIVHLHCLNGYTVNIYKLIEWLKNQKIKTVLTLHAEFMYTGNCGHSIDCEKWRTGCGKCPRFRKETNSFFFDRTHVSWRLMKNAFDGFDTLLIASVSPWLMERAKCSPILADKKHAVVYNGLDTSVFCVQDTTSLKEKYRLTGEKIVFHATPVFSDDPEHLKGGYYVLKLAERFKERGVRFIVAGTHYIKNENIPENVTLLGQVNDQSLLAKFYSVANVTLLTSQRETFSMICAESLCCGTPVVGFKAGAPEQISLSSYSRFVEYGDLDGLENSLMAFLENSFDKNEISEEAKKSYSKESMTDGYLQIYEMLNGR